MKGHRIVGTILGLLLLILSGLMLLPALVDKVMGGDDWFCFVLGAFITAFVGGCLVFSQRRSSLPPLGHSQTFLLTTLSWLLMAGFAALPFCFSKVHLSYTDAFFESMSGFTTTGSTVMAHLQDAPRGIIFWRALTQGVGGLGIVVMAVAVLPFLRIGGMQLFKTESSDQSEKILPRPGQIAFTVMKTYFSLTALCTLAYLLCHMNLFDAVTGAMATISTGGYANYDDSFGHFNNNHELAWVASFFMVLGSLPLLLYVHIWRGQIMRFLGDAQVRGFIIFLAVVIAVVAGWLTLHGLFSFPDALRAATFNIVSVVSTTGFTTYDYSRWGHFPAMIFLLLLFAGGCTGSTAGGIKMFRFQILISVIRIQLCRMLFPNSVQKLHYGDRILDSDIVISISTFVALFIASAIVSTLILTMTGLDILTSLSSAVQALSNVGPGLGETTGPCCTFAAVSDAAKWTLSLTMLLGRLEIMTILILFWRDYWRV